jgi:hypothetical protein
MSPNAQSLPHSVPDQAIKGLENFLGYKFDDKDLACEAMQRTPCTPLANKSNMTQGNRRLGVVGDFMIDLILSRNWYKSNQNCGE